MCISLDYKTNKRQVIDGLQRMKSIINFLSKEEWKLSSLDDIEPKISGKTKIDDYQVTLIKKHLAMVFATHIDATFGPKETQELLSQLHNSKVDAMPKC
jgi:hypothetical protein